MSTAQQPVGRPTVAPRERRTRLVLAVVAGMAALLCLGGAGIFFVLYDDATEINRSAPDVVVDNYLRAALVERSEDRTALFRCDQPGDLTMLATLQREIIEREERFNVAVSVSWSSLFVKDDGESRRLVDVALTIAGSADGQPRSRRTENWTFEVTDQDGWRVCSARKVS